MLIKILSVVINGRRSHKVIVPGGCYLDVDIIRKIELKIKMLLGCLHMRYLESVGFLIHCCHENTLVLVC